MAIRGTARSGKAASRRGPQKEQFFDLSGKTSQDITVPTWAKACRITGYVYVPASAAVINRVSVDGTTFFAGATDYQQGGPVHNTGSAAYTTSAQVGATWAAITPTSDNGSAAQNFTLDMNLVRALTNQVFVQRAYAKAIDSSAANIFRTYHNLTYLTAALTTALSIKAIRILLTTGAAMGAGSSLHIQWLGDDAQMPVSNAISEAYADTRYVNVTGDTMSGDLTISKSTPTVILNKAADTQNAALQMQTVGVLRWGILASSAAESGSNAGSDFWVYRYNDAGTLIDSPFGINRATGVVTATGLAPKPQAAAGVGQFYVATGSSGGAVSLPAGGTWAAVAWGFNGSGVIQYANNGGVLAGGSTVIGASAGITGTIWAWRIA